MFPSAFNPFSITITFRKGTPALPGSASNDMGFRKLPRFVDRLRSGLPRVKAGRTGDHAQ